MSSSLCDRDNGSITMVALKMSVTIVSNLAFIIVLDGLIEIVDRIASLCSLVDISTNFEVNSN
jgi:hypothetical protein